MYHLQAWYSRKSEESARLSGTGVINSTEPWCGCWEPNLHHLQEQQMLMSCLSSPWSQLISVTLLVTMGEMDQAPQALKSSLLLILINHSIGFKDHAFQSKSKTNLTENTGLRTPSWVGLLGAWLLGELWIGELWAPMWNENEEHLGGRGRERGEWGWDARVYQTSAELSALPPTAVTAGLSHPTVKSALLCCTLRAAWIAAGRFSRIPSSCHQAGLQHKSTSASIGYPSRDLSPALCLCGFISLWHRMDSVAPRCCYPLTIPVLLIITDSIFLCPICYCLLKRDVRFSLPALVYMTWFVYLPTRVSQMNPVYYLTPPPNPSSSEERRKGYTSVKWQHLWKIRVRPTWLSSDTSSSPVPQTLFISLTSDRS